MQKEEIIQIIEDAFKDVPYPGDDRISDDGYDESECVAKRLKGVKNEDITRDFLYNMDRHPSCFIPWLYPEAYHYYIKSFMLLIVNYHKQLGDWEAYILYSLLPIEPEHSSYKEDIKKYDIFSAQQKHTIRLFLEYLLTAFPDYYSDDMGDGTPFDALNWYWEKY